MLSEAQDVTPFLQLCRQLPHATESVKWDNDLVFSIGGKMFAVFDQADGKRFSFKTTPGTFAFLTARPGVSPAPYAARFHWISLADPTVLPAAEIVDLLRESYHLVSLSLPARVRRQLGVSREP